MATTKKTPIEEAVVEAPVEKKAPAKKTTKKATVKETAVKAEETKAPAKKTATRKTVAKKTVVKEATCEMAVQFAGKSYTQADLVKIAKDVWVYDLNQKAEELEKIELYVKLEEHKVYYVFNGTETGSFQI